ncbi:uncharacterized protein STEHIDRAFT_134713 [Stereum hirsutum FP-91666 SS1]|uniref:uncharacterized protein n=1 Tax=Stereum hirsutum (strain FP-91666) TaxID=721885 RepID=UPI000444998F|nr:uncharacterized protein STEHIDRAFT_134713 [Stereum hirsutum FP-91666 SS1]EIM81000.1 hypothetical protein STEHIDRAFT_134713 [Stereum hirsutum FP-91666 SS1]
MSQRGNSETGHAKERDCLEPTPVGFWSSGLADVRKQVAGKWLSTTLILLAFIMVILSLYWGSQFNTVKNYHLLNVYIADFDGQVEPYTSTTPIIGPAAAWATLIINPNATALVMQAIQQGNASYGPAGAFPLVIASAREDTTIYSYVLPDLTTTMNLMIGQVGQIMAAGNDTLLNNLQAVPQALSPAVGFSTIDLRPVLPPVATPTVSVGLIYLIITSFFATTFYMPVHQLFLNTSAGHPPLKKCQWMLYRYISSIPAYFLLSLAYSLVSLAFLIPFSLPSYSHTSPRPSATRYGKGSFVVFWILNWVGMTALELASENVGMAVGMPWMAFWLIFWVISNMCTSFYTITLAPGFYKWGYAWPQHNIVQATGTIVFDRKSH